MAGFSYKKSLLTKDAPVEIPFIINNSEAVQIGDAIQVDTNGHAILATAGEEVAGIAVAVTDYNDTAIDPDTSTLDTYTVASDNETVAKKKVKLVMDKYSLFENDADEDLDLTDLMKFFNLIDENTIDASSVNANNGQFQLISLDPNDASKGLFRIAESQLDPYTQD